MTNLSTQQVARFEKDGYLLIREFFSKKEIERLHEVAIHDDIISKNVIDINDGKGRTTKLSLWYKPGDDIYGLLTRSNRMVTAVDQLLDGDAAVCHYHSKLMQKEPRVGGAWEWHQDYGYWYKNEFLFPDQLISVMVAITEATRQNGCLQVIKGSHKIGRIEHGLKGEQNGAALRYVDLALANLEHEYVELNPGDVLFFHSNLLHRSEANLSDKPRWSLISCYNRQTNKGYNESSPDSASTTPISVVADSSLLESVAKGLDESNADFLKKESDVSIKS